MSVPTAVPATATAPLAAARRLHGYLAARHVHDQRLAGADQGIRWNIRIGRFVKSYLPMLRPVERFWFIQGQAYWAQASWTLGDLTGEPSYHAAARAATQAILEAQRPDGAWDYPLPERRHLIATVEGDFGAMAMLASWQRDRDPAMLAGARRWHDYLEREIGYQAHPGGLCVNYFQKPRGLVPNNTCEWIWVLGALQRATGEARYLERVPAMLGFLEAVQMPSGELPYELAGGSESRTRPHYLCFQYNAFQCMKLAAYAHDHGDARAQRIAERLSDFLATGVRDKGSVRASCASIAPEVVYYADAVGMALHTVSQYGWRDHHALADRTYRWVLGLQRADGGFPWFSRADYGVLTDRNEYPRYLAMTLAHLSERARSGRPLAAAGGRA
ncbi:MAG: hypothetical protein ABL977_15445 [Candidatus Eisenbacteria bacterium]